MNNIIQLISGPRNISTALMYSFGNRGDTVIVDEPFYACYLSRYKVDYHPGTKEILDAMSPDPKLVINDLMMFAIQNDYLFVKNMAHHLQGFNYSYTYGVKNVFLIRNPQELINSFAKIIKTPKGIDIGIEREYEIYIEILKKGKYPPIVLDSGEILKNPEKVLGKLCNKLGIPFSDKMLKWEPGERKEDGIWAKYWYDNVHKSTGFKKQERSAAPLKEEFKELFNEVNPFYQELFEVSIKA